MLSSFAILVFLRKQLILLQKLLLLSRPVISVELPAGLKDADSLNWLPSPPLCDWGAESK